MIICDGVGFDAPGFYWCCQGVLSWSRIARRAAKNSAVFECAVALGVCSKGTLCAL